MVGGGGHGAIKAHIAFNQLIFRNKREFWSRRIRNLNGLGCTCGVATSVVCCECPYQGEGIGTITGNGVIHDCDGSLSTIVHGGSIIEHQLIRAFCAVTFGDKCEDGSLRIRHCDRLDPNGLVETFVQCGESPSQNIALCTRIVVRLFQCHQSQSTCVARKRIQKKQFIATIRFIARWHKQVWPSGVDDRNDLRRLRAVASIISCREGANELVLMGTISCNGLAGHFNGDLTTVVRGCCVVEDQVVRALACVVRGH